MKTSPLFTINWRDIAKGLLIAILTPTLVLIQQSLSAGTLTLNWEQLGMAAVGGGVAYLIKNFLTPAQIVSTLDPSLTDKK
jgi:hypothetical protein